jgi:hypothetical protein
MLRLFMAALLSALIPTCYGTIRPVVGSLDLNNMVDISDAVVAGTIESIDTVTEEPMSLGGVAVKCSHHRAVLSIERVYKGSATNEIAVFFDTFDNPTVPQYHFAQGQRTLLFLKSGNQGNYFLTNAFTSVFYPSNIRADLNSDRSGFEQLQFDLISGLTDSDTRRLLVNLELLQGSRHLTSAKPVVPLLRSSDPNVVIWSFAILIKNRCFDFNPQLVLFLDRLPANGPFSLLELANSLDSLATDTKQLPTLIKLSSSNHLAIKNAAMNLLRRMRSPQSIPAILARLDDSDVYIRFTAIKSLSEITGLEDPHYSPDLSTYLQNPAAYTTAWRQWAIANAAKKH